MILLDQKIEERRDHDDHTIVAVLDEQARPTRRRIYVFAPLQGIPPGALVAPRWFVHAMVFDEDAARVHWEQDVATWFGGAWHFARGDRPESQVAGIRAWGADYDFDLRTGALRLTEPGYDEWMVRRVYPPRETTRLFAAWLRQWLPDRGPVKNPGRVPRRR